MKFEVSMDAQQIFDEIQSAFADDAEVEDLTITFIGSIDKNGKVKIDKATLHGTCVTEYCNSFNVR